MVNAFQPYIVTMYVPTFNQECTHCTYIQLPTNRVHTDYVQHTVTMYVPSFNQQSVLCSIFNQQNSHNVTMFNFQHTHCSQIQFLTEFTNCNKSTTFNNQNSYV